MMQLARMPVVASGSLVFCVHSCAATKPLTAPPCSCTARPAAGSLFLLNAQSNTSMLDFVNNCFDIKDNHHVHHR